MKVGILNCKEEEIVNMLNLPECQNNEMHILYSTTVTFLFETAVSIIGGWVVRNMYGDYTKQSNEVKEKKSERIINSQESRLGRRRGGRSSAQRSEEVNPAVADLKKQRESAGYLWDWVGQKE